MVQDITLKFSPKQVFALGVLFVLFVLFVAVGADSGLVLNLADPAPSSVPNPGHSSVDIVVNVSGSGACSGDISLQEAIDNGCLFPVGKCAPEEVIMGDGSCQNLGNFVGDTVTNIFTSSTNLSCEASPAITTPGDNAYHAYTVPAACRGGNKCVLKVEYYLSGNPWQTRTLEYIQYTDNKWHSSIYSVGQTYNNGDATLTWVDYAYGGTYWADDLSGTENNATQWSIYTGVGWSTKFYVCTYT